MPLNWLTPHSPQTRAIAGLFDEILIVAGFVFLVVAALVIYSVIRYRRRPGAGEPPQTSGSKTLEIVWTAIPLAIVAGLFILTVRAMDRIEPPQRTGRAPDLVVTGHQWWWDARYPNGALAVGEIHIPVSKKLLVKIESTDVIHDFWVPQLARKMDAIPGVESLIWLEADQPGTYQGLCSEFCGAQHAWMQFRVIAEPAADFEAWVKRQVEPLPPPPSLYEQKKCGECHATGKGPSLAHVASRAFLGAGVSPNTPAHMALWVRRPQSIKPGNRMPDQELSDAETSSLTAYLETLH